MLVENVIQVPISLCYPSPLMALPYSTEKRTKDISVILDAKGTLLYPRARAVSGRFEILQSWDIVQQLSSRGKEFVNVLHANYSDADVVSLSIVEQAKLVDLHWISLARAFANAKSVLGWEDKQLSDASGIWNPSNKIDRSKVTRLINISKRLTPKFQSMAEKGRLTLSAARKIITVSAQVQNEVATIASDRAWDQSKIMSHLFPQDASSIKHSAPVPVGFVRDKDTDTKRLEVLLSGTIGFPIEVESSSEVSGVVCLQFFDKRDLVTLVNKLLKGLDGSSKLAGKLCIQYDNLDQFDAIFGSHLKEDI